MLAILRLHPVASAICAIIVVALARFIAKGYGIRKKSHGKPGPPHSWILGHLKAVGEVAGSYPRRVHPHVYPAKLRKNHNLGSIVYMDVWPAGPPMIAVMDPEISQQMSVQHNTLKHPTIGSYLEPLLGKDDMVSSNGQLWQQWRKMFNAGFSTQHLMTLVPGIVDDVLIYADKLKDRAAKEDIFRLEEDTTRLTIDVIGKVTMDLNFNMQRSDNPCIGALREQVHLLGNETTNNPFEKYYPYGIYKRWVNDRYMANYIGKVLDDRFATTDATTSKKQKKRTIIDLALDSYVTGVEADLEKSPTGQLPKMDAEFRKGAITQIRTFLFAGHDTTSSTMCYAFYLLQKHPKCLQRIREEHEEVLGSLQDSAETIKTQPHLLNRLEYTQCVIKETMRLFPPASAPRQGEPGLTIRDPKTGEEYPTEGFMIWLNHYGLHHHEDFFENPYSFDPSRFMPENIHKIPEGAFRPFEMGPRNCLGQNLAMLEGRIILALACRQFEFDVKLEAIEELKSDGSFYAKNESFRHGKQDVDGEGLYQVLIGAAKPREGMPVQVRKVDWKK